MARKSSTAEVKPDATVKPNVAHRMTRKSSFAQMDVQAFADAELWDSAQETFNTTGNNGGAYCSAYCAYNWNNEGSNQGWTGACCKAAFKEDGTPVTCTTMGQAGVAGGSLKCMCGRDDTQPFQTGSQDAYFTGGICGQFCEGSTCQESINLMDGPLTIDTTSNR